MKPSSGMDKYPYQKCKEINQSLFGTDTCPYILRAPFYINFYEHFFVRIKGI